MTAPSTLERPDTRPQPGSGEGKATHIVKRPVGEESPQAWVLRARIEGLEVEALCGYRWIPQDNPANHPICQKCLAVYYGKVDPSKGLPDA